MLVSKKYISLNCNQNYNVMFTEYFSANFLTAHTNTSSNAIYLRSDSTFEDIYEAAVLHGHMKVDFLIGSRNVKTWFDANENFHMALTEEGSNKIIDEWIREANGDIKNV